MDNSIRGLSDENVWDYENGFYWFSSKSRLNKMLAHYELYKSIVGFDAFGAFPTDQLKIKHDVDFIERFESAGGHGLSEGEAKNILYSKGFENFSLVKGNVFDTLPAYLEDSPETRIALLHLDMDVKEPTDFALELLYERVVPGGLIVFDDYNAVAGATISADSFVKKHHLKLEKLPFYNAPAFIRKPN